jgi:demethylmenaquinone methyltransferase/2-methoxy-6-polyprenyl-1,4-benzoquinol methylase
MASTDQPGGAGSPVAAMFGRIAGFYDLLNRVLSLGLDAAWRSRMLDFLPPVPDARVLDLAAGTLDVSRGVLKRLHASRVTAADICSPMLQRGLKKLSEPERTRLDPVIADGLALPFPDNAFQAATIAFGIRNITPREQALAELARVLAPSGRLLILEFGTASKPLFKGLYNVYLTRILPRIGGLVSGDRSAYDYLARTIQAFPTERALALMMRRAGFARVLHLPLSRGIVQLHVGAIPEQASQD